MKNRLFPILWFGISGLLISLMVQFILPLVSPDFYWPKLRFGFPEILLIIISMPVGYWLGYKMMLLKPKEKSFVAMMSVNFNALGYGLLGGLIVLIVFYLLLFSGAMTQSMSESIFSSERWLGFLFFFAMEGWAVVVLWMLFGWLFWLINFLLRKPQ